MELSQTHTRVLQQIELEILRVFIEICEKLNLKYYALGGTLLGAVRHQGFIPWDDDIDVGMPRKDYDIFVQRAQEYLPKHLFLQTHMTDPESPFAFAKIRDSNTTYIQFHIRKQKMHHGIYIDIFPLDYYSDTYIRKSFYRKKRWCRRRVGCVYDVGKIGIKTHISQMLARILMPTLQDAISKKENLYRSVPRGDTYVNHEGAYGVKEIMPVAWYGEGINLVFEGLNVVVPREYDLWLTQVYGNYRELPPLEKRKTHHDVVVIDAEKPYTDYVGDFL